MVLLSVVKCVFHDLWLCLFAYCLVLGNVGIGEQLRCRCMLVDNVALFYSVTFDGALYLECYPLAHCRFVNSV